MIGTSVRIIATGRIGRIDRTRHFLGKTWLFVILSNGEEVCVERHEIRPV
jgi:hypothetical protein